MAESLALTDYKNLASLQVKHQDRRLAKSDIRPVFALDTETDKNGTIRIIADSNGRYWTPSSHISCLEFLHSKRYQGTWNFFYNLTFDAEVILKTLGKTLYNYKKTRKLIFQFEDYKLEYIPGKKLSIRKGHHSSVFFDIAQYYHSSLVDAYKKNIGPLDQNYLKFKTKRDLFSDSFYKRYSRKIRDYCIQDCKLTKQLC